MAQFRYHNICHMCPKHFLKIAGKPSNYRYCKLLMRSQFLGKFLKLLKLSFFAEINQVPSPYSLLQHIGRVATTRLVPKNCLRYLDGNNIDNGKREISLRIYLRYCRPEGTKNIRASANKVFVLRSFGYKKAR